MSGVSTINTIINVENEGSNETRVWYDCERPETISEAITAAVCEHKSCGVTDLSSLTDYADPNALDALFGTENPSSPTINRGFLEFRYDDVSVEISSVGKIVVRDL
ncbi:HalOD1 output domain-containing protein [Haloferax namakaokahaiae]|uniref:HalOD1 output domain-containing protein n=1 Tax=Haloferax namakaokahaiae TaxID=1748331 RepID=A0ABD5ZBY0_9EURY